MDVNALVWPNKHSTALVGRTIRSHLICFITYKHVHVSRTQTHAYIFCMSCIIHTVHFRINVKVRNRVLFKTSSY
jgi:hypothetical protein